MTTPVQEPNTRDIKFVPLGVLYEQAEWALDELHDRANAIDAKCAAVFTSSSFLLAGMAALQAAIAAHAAKMSPQTEMHMRLLGGGVAVTFLFVAGLSVAAMWPRTFTIAPLPPELLKKYYYKSEDETKQVVTESRIGAYDDTAKKVRCKSRLMIASFIVVIIESVLLVLVLAVATESL